MHIYSPGHLLKAWFRWFLFELRTDAVQVGAATASRNT
jgi:hypothetical protein